MKSYRIDRGPRQRTILELGKLNLPKEEWKLLADQIETKITGQQFLFFVDENIENLATHYTNLVIHKRLITYQSGEMECQEKDILPEYETVDVKSLFNCRSWTIGEEYVGYSMFKNLELEEIFQGLGFSKGITVVIDAEIATEENVELLKGAGYDYICVARNKNDLLTIKEDRDNKVEV